MFKNVDKKRTIMTIKCIKDDAGRTEIFMCDNITGVIKNLREIYDFKIDCDFYLDEKFNLTAKKGVYTYDTNLKKRGHWNNSEYIIRQYRGLVQNMYPMALLNVKEYLKIKSTMDSFLTLVAAKF